MKLIKNKLVERLENEEHKICFEVSQIFEHTALLKNC